MIPAETPWREARIAVIDTETTGVGSEDRIVELAIAIGERGEIVDRRAWVLNPGRPIPEEATAIHGIKEADVLRAPTFAEVAVEIGQASMLLHGSACHVPLDADEQRAVRAWRRAVQPRRIVNGTLIPTTEELICGGLVTWSDARDYEATPEGTERIARPEFSWWRWEAALFAPIARRVEAWSREGLARVAAGGER